MRSTPGAGQFPQRREETSHYTSLVQDKTVRRSLQWTGGSRHCPDLVTGYQTNGLLRRDRLDCQRSLLHRGFLVCPRARV